MAMSEPRDVSTQQSPREFKQSREATIFCVGDRVLAMSIMITDLGMPVAGAEIRIVIGFKPEEIGNAVRHVLSKFKVSVPHPDQGGWRAMEKPFLKATGFSSMRRFQLAMERRVSVSDDGRQIRVIPNAKIADKYGGFRPNGVEPESLSSKASAEDIGLAVLRAFENCTTVSA